MDTQCILPEEATREFRRLECDLESSFPGRIIVSGLAVSCQAILWMVLAKQCDLESYFPGRINSWPALGPGKWMSKSDNCVHTLMENLALLWYHQEVS